MRIHILLAVDQAQVVGCAVTMRSAIDNVATNATLHFHVLTHRVRMADQDRLRRTVCVPDVGHCISLVEANLAPFRSLLRSKTISHATYARFLLTEVLPAEAERCLYLDCDMVVRIDLAEAWNVNLRDCTVGAVPNGREAEARRYQERLGLAEPRYLNAGFLVIDVLRWRARDVSPRAIDAARSLGDRLILHDQDALNVAVQGDWTELPTQWNAAVPWDSGLSEESHAVFHYMGAPKPWDLDYRGRFGSLFTAYRSRTPYAALRPWNPLGLGALIARARRRVPYVPTVLRVLRSRLLALLRP